MLLTQQSAYDRPAAWLGAVQTWAHEEGTAE